MILTTLSPSCSIDDWKEQISSFLDTDPKSISLMIRGNVHIENNTIRSYGINPETMVYVKFKWPVCLQNHENNTPAFQ